jgi:hypothetical protein
MIERLEKDCLNHQKNILQYQNKVDADRQQAEHRKNEV